MAVAAGAGVGVVWYATRADKAASETPFDTGTASAKDNAPALTLDQGQREFLWQVEHHGLVLSRYGFPRLADAISQADVQALDDILAPDFQGQTLGQPHEVRLANEFALVVRQQDAGRPAEALGRTGFIARLLEYRRAFVKPPKVQFALMALAPLARETLAGPWKGTCLLRMWGEMAGDTQGKRPKGDSRAAPISAASAGPPTASGPGEVLLALTYQIAQPSEKMRVDKAWLRRCAIGQTQVSRAPQFLMREVTAERGIDTSRLYDNWNQELSHPNTGSVCLCDFNRDGILDILITDFNGYFLYKGLPGGKFVDVTAQVGLPRKPLTRSPVATLAAFVDLDGDGWEDLILGDRIYRNEGGQSFLDYTAATNLHLPRDAGGISVADFDGDGRMDLYVLRPGRAKFSSYLDGSAGDLAGNQLWRNKGNWQFEDVTAKSGASGGSRSSFSAVWLDANNDGWPDLYVINEFGKGILLLNNGDGTFREHLLVDGPGDFGSMGVTCGDIDNDGNIDLYVANMYSKAGNRVMSNLLPGTYPDDVMATMRQFVAGSQLYRNLGLEREAASAEREGHAAPRSALGAPRFEPLGKEYQVAAVGWAYGAALIDLDNDGWLDLYATCGFVSRSRTEPDG